MPNESSVRGPKVQTLLVRNRDTVHLATCRYNVTGLPWEWAEGLTRAEVKAAEVNGLRFCRTCKPLDALPVDVTT